MGNSLFSVLSATTSKVSGLQPITKLAFLISLLSLLLSPLADYSEVQCTGHNRLVEGFQHLAAHIEGSQLPEEIQFAHPLLIYSLTVGLLVQSSLMWMPKYL